MRLGGGHGELGNQIGREELGHGLKGRDVRGHFIGY